MKTSLECGQRKKKSTGGKAGGVRCAYGAMPCQENDIKAVKKNRRLLR